MHATESRRRKHRSLFWVTLKLYRKRPVRLTGRPMTRVKTERLSSLSYFNPCTRYKSDKVRTYEYK
jgi:hypothetical protein